VAAEMATMMLMVLLFMAAPFDFTTRFLNDATFFYSLAVFEWIIDSS